MINLKDRLGDREEVRLGEQFYILKNYSFSRNEEDINGEIKHIHYGDIHTGLSSIIKNTMNIPTLNNEIEINLKDLINDNDLIIADASEDYQDLGKTIYIEKLNNDRVVAGLHTFHLRKKDKIEPKYFKYFTESIKYKKQMYKSGTGTSVFGISKANLEKVIIPYINEINQIKISNFLSSIDILIEKQEEYINQLKEQKQGYMQKIFAQELRFKGFNDEWIIKKVGEIFEITRGEVLSKNNTDILNGKYPIYSSQTTNNGLMGYYNEYLFENAITWTTDGANAGDVNMRYGKFYCTNVCGVLQSKKGYANQFMAEQLNKITHKYVSYVGNPKLMNNTMGEIKVLVPSLEEQNKIASLLSSMDNFIIIKYNIILNF